MRRIMLTFKQYITEANEEEVSEDESRVFRVDPVDRSVEDSWKNQEYGVLPNNAGTGALNQIPKGMKIDRVEKTTFATPGRPNLFYGALGRNAGPNGTPVRGAAVYDENKMFGEKRDRSYKGELHITQEDYDNIPEKVRVSHADGGAFSQKAYSDKSEVTSDGPIKDIRSKIVDTRAHLNRQYNVVIHPNVDSIRSHIEKVQKEQPHLSILNQL